MLTKDKFDNHVEKDVEPVENYDQPENTKQEEEYIEPEWDGNEKKNLIDRIIDFFAFGTEEVPDIISMRFRSFLLIAAAVAVGGSLLMLLMHTYTAIIFCFVFGLIIALYGYSIMLSATKKGYDTIVGECIRIDYTMSSNLPGTRNMPKRFLIMDVDSHIVYALPYYKRGLLVEEGDLVRIIVPKDIYAYKRGDITNLSEVWGYDIIPELNEERNKRLGIDE